MNIRILHRILGFAVLFGLAGAQAACSTNAATGRSQLSVLSRDEQIKLGADAMPELTKEFGGEVTDTQLEAYVTNIGRQLSAQTEADNPGLPWEFTLLNSGVINAFALPGGKVFISRGLAEQMENEAMMAHVLGHEVGHVTAEHTSERISQGIVVGGGATVLGAVIGATSDNDAVRAGAPVAFAIGGSLVTLKFSRDQESEADKLGMRYMTKLNYDPMAALQVMQLLDRASKGDKQPELLATHPYPETRIKRIREALQGEYAYTQGNPQFSLHKQRYEQQFLARVRTLPPPAQATNPSSFNAFALGFAPDASSGVSALSVSTQSPDDHPADGIFRDVTPARLDWAIPATWCGHCAAAPRR